MEEKVLIGKLASQFNYMVEKQLNALTEELGVAIPKSVLRQAVEKDVLIGMVNELWEENSRLKYQYKVLMNISDLDDDHVELEDYV